MRRKQNQLEAEIAFLKNQIKALWETIQLPPETTNTSSQTSREEMEDKFTDSTGNKAATPTSKCNQWLEDDFATKVRYEALIIITGVIRYIQVPC